MTLCCSCGGSVSNCTLWEALCTVHCEISWAKCQCTVAVCDTLNCALCNVISPVEYMDTSQHLDKVSMHSGSLSKNQCSSRRSCLNASVHPQLSLKTLCWTAVRYGTKIDPPKKYDLNLNLSFKFDLKFRTYSNFII